MPFPYSLTSLPKSLLLLILASSSISADEQLLWPRNLPRHIKYFPEQDSLVKRGIENMERLQVEKPIGMRQMSDDQDEMFFLDYWLFDEESSDGSDHCPIRPPGRSFGGNISLSSEDALLPPLLVHSIGEMHQKRGWLGPYAEFAKRDFQCPQGYGNCGAMGAPGLCCPGGQTCVSISNSNSGNVGCCPAGQTCANGVSVGDCDTNAGYQSCPSGPGCCIPGFSCQSTGCISYFTSTTTVTAGTVVATSCPADATSCASSLGGGCCATGLSCGPSNQCVGAATSTVTQTAAGTTVVPAVSIATSTSASQSTTDSLESAADPSTTVIGTQTIGLCPQSYYFCSAYYRPGCCHVDRSCATTNCPQAPSTSFFTRNGVTVGVPVGVPTGGGSYTSTFLITSAGPVRQPSCQNGWNVCAASGGGKCCPDGFNCVSSDLACISGTSQVAQQNPTGVGVNDRVVGIVSWIGIVFGCAAGVLMVVL